MSGGITLRLSDAAARAVRDLATEHDYSPGELARLGFSIVKLVLDERARGNLLIVATPAGKPLKKIVLPKPEELRTPSETAALGNKGDSISFLEKLYKLGDENSPDENKGQTR